MVYFSIHIHIPPLETAHRYFFLFNLMIYQYVAHGDFDEDDATCAEISVLKIYLQLVLWLKIYLQLVLWLMFEKNIFFSWFSG